MAYESLGYDGIALLLLAYRSQIAIQLYVSQDVLEVLCFLFHVRYHREGAASSGHFFQPP